MAEEFFQSALALLAKWGLQSELVACELYNSIAQMMIMKHKQWFSHRSVKIYLHFYRIYENKRTISFSKFLK